MTVTKKRSTDRLSGIKGVLFLTAGFGTRAEPLSFCRPKALLPWRDTTLLGNLIRQFAVLEPEVMVFNCSRCRRLIQEEARKHWEGEMAVFFEERPLGTPGTLARNCEMLESGHWILVNTDMVLDLPISEMVDFHLRSGSSWTVLTGDFPGYGSYGALTVNGWRRHYMGVSIISGRIPMIAERNQLSFGFFSELRNLAASEGIEISEYFYGDSEWLDMGEIELFRKHVLSQGSYIHPAAEVHDGAVLEGFYWIGSSCIIQNDSLVRNSVALEGSTLCSGASLIEDVLPWYAIKEL